MEEARHYASLDISLHRFQSDQYTVSLHFSLPEEVSDVETSIGGPGVASFDLPALLSLEGDPIAYGQQLSRCLFSDEQVKAAFQAAQTAAESRSLALRLRLEIDPLAIRLHNLRWETLASPLDGATLTTNENSLFSRFLAGRDWKPVKPRSMRELRGLVMVANPSDLGDYGLAPVDTSNEIERANLALVGIPLTTIPGDAPVASLDELMRILRAGEYELLYIVCHGVLVGDEPYLFLQAENGQTARVSGADLVQRLRELPSLPRLAVLASCQSAGGGSATPGAGYSLSAVGPRLAEGGVPAVVAMQGNISMETSGIFFSEFFKQLQVDGQIDRAMTVARGQVRQQPDFWMPVLFMRLKSGRGWYTPGAGEGGSFKGWDGLVDSINRGKCTPILGPGLFEPLLGSLREIASSWAHKYNYPLAEYERESLPQVAQYLAVMQGLDFPVHKFEEDLAEHLIERYRDRLTQERLDRVQNVDALIDLIGSLRRNGEPLDAYKVLAGLPLSIYLTTNLNNLLGAALIEAGKQPEVVVCPWNNDQAMVNTVFDREHDYTPSVERPLVYHLFGRLDQPGSVVLTEDDYFSYLIGFTKNKNLVPDVVRGALNDTALLFLGFQMEDWSFRVLYQSLLKEPSPSRNRYLHVAAQVEPTEDYILEPSNVRNYLDTYFKRSASRTSLFWGTTEEFLKEMVYQIEKAPRGGPFRMKAAGAAQ